MWINSPNKPGYWLFVGLRKTRARGFINQIASPAEVKNEEGFQELIVFYPNSGLAYGISQHKGKWFSLEGLLSDGLKEFNRSQSGDQADE